MTTGTEDSVDAAPDAGGAAGERGTLEREATLVASRPERSTETLLSTVPSQRSAPDLNLVAPPARRSRAWAVGTVSALVALALAGTGAVALDRAHDRRIAAERTADAERAASAAGARGSDTRLAAAAAGRALVEEHARGAAQAAVDHARATLAAAPDAGAGLRDALDRQATAVSTVLGGTGAQADELAAATSELAAADRRVTDAQAAFQAAAAAQAAAQAAAAQAAAQAQADAAAAATAAARSVSSRKPARPAAPKAPVAAKPVTRQPPATSGGGSTAALASVPAGGLQCTGAGSGAGAASVRALGDAINAYRAAHGLATLRVAASSTLTNHALQMANTGGIWHSGHDNIVGCVSNGSYASLVTAWDNSAPHRAQMQRTGITQMLVGDATRGGWLYGAVYFS